MIKKQISPYQWFPDTEDYQKSIELCIRIWDAVSVSHLLTNSLHSNTVTQLYAGVQTVGKELREAKMFKDTDDWMKPKR